MADCMQQYLEMSRAKGAAAPSVDVWGGTQANAITTDDDDDEDDGKSWLFCC